MELRTLSKEKKEFIEGIVSMYYAQSVVRIEPYFGVVNSDKPLLKGIPLPTDEQQEVVLYGDVTAHIGKNDQLTWEKSLSVQEGIFLNSDMNKGALEFKNVLFTNMHFATNGNDSYYYFVGYKITLTS